MKLAKYLISLALSASACIMPATTLAQARCELPVNVTVNNPDGTLSDANMALLANKLTQVVAREGFGGSETAYLCLSAEVSETSKEVISGVRPVIASSMDVYLVISNILTGDKYGATTISLKGSGASEARTYQAAFAQINTSNRALLDFVRDTHAKVISYYDGHLSAIISNARILAGREDFEKALAMLYTVPECVNDYDLAGEAMIEIWQRYVDLDCARKLSKARAVWATSKGQEGAEAAAAYLAAIHPDSSCKEDAAELLREIESFLDEETARRLAREEDNHQWEREKERFEMEMRRQQLEAARDLSQAYIQTLINNAAQAPVQSAPQSAPQPSTQPVTQPVIIVK